MIGFFSIMVTGQWYSPGIKVSPNNKTDRHDITEILLKVALNTLTLTLKEWSLFARCKVKICPP
jgi:hypothetical protein